MKRRSWLAQSAHRTGGGPHADRRERRSCSTRRQLREREVSEHLACSPEFPPGWDSVPNTEGLTWVEWAYAAGIDPSPSLFATVHALYTWRARWAAGEDPTEYRTTSR